MKRLTFVTSLAAVLACATSAVGQQDHLLCYDIQDPLKISEAVRMIAEQQPDFSARCKLLKGIEFCVPATKRRLSPPPNEVPGQPLKDDYLCYAAVCENPDLEPDRLVRDQFGTRVINLHRPRKVCVPARKGPQPCGGDTAAECAGACPTADRECRFDETVEECTCSPTTRECSVDTAGVCGGPCPDPDEVCTTTRSGDCRCVGRPQPCGFDANGVCGGPCPPDQICTLGSAGDCRCMRECQLDAAGVCGGACPNLGDVCAPVAGAPCVCQRPCGMTAAGQCGGFCPNNGVCALSTATNTCSCNSLSGG